MRRNIYCALIIIGRCGMSKRIVKHSRDRDETMFFTGQLCIDAYYSDSVAIQTKCVYWHDISYISLLLAPSTIADQSFFSFFFFTLLLYPTLMKFNEILVTCCKLICVISAISFVSAAEKASNKCSKEIF